MFGTSVVTFDHPFIHFDHRGQIYCPLDLRLTEIQVPWGTKDPCFFVGSWGGLVVAGVGFLVQSLQNFCGDDSSSLRKISQVLAKLDDFMKMKMLGTWGAGR